MPTINYATKEISVKIVYYGPGLSGKTTNLQVIHIKVPPEHKSDMVSLATETDRTLFFDFLPLDLGTIKGFATKFQLYTVPGQVYYNATRKLVLRGVDGIVFVADSAADKLQDNIESYRNLEENLAEYGYQKENIAMVIQYNKRDLPNALAIEELQRHLNKDNLPYCQAIANKGQGVFETLKLIGKLVIDNLNKKYSKTSSPPQLSKTHPQTFSQKDRIPSVQASGPQSAQRAHPTARFVSPQQPSQPQAFEQRKTQPLQTQNAFPSSGIAAPSSVNEQRIQDPFIDIFEPSRPSQPIKQSSEIDIERPQGLSWGAMDYGIQNQQNVIQQQPSYIQPKQEIPTFEIQKPSFPSQQTYQQQHPFQTQQQPPTQQFHNFQAQKISDRPPFQQHGNQGTHLQPQPSSPIFEVNQQMPQQWNVSQDYQQSPTAQFQYQQAPYQQSPLTQNTETDDQLFFTSVNTDKTKKGKKPINPKKKPRGGFFSRLFGK